jgi:septal ring factor EnvC (AmiA/AmiB activator)
MTPDARIAELEAEVDAAWATIRNTFDVEPRSQLEAEAKDNGFKYGLAQAIHHIWKRDAKIEALTAANARLADELAGVREELARIEAAATAKERERCVESALKEAESYSRVGEPVLYATLIKLADQLEKGA